MKLSKREYLELDHDLSGYIVEFANADGYATQEIDWFDDEIVHDGKTYQVEANVNIWQSVGYEYSGHEDHEARMKMNIELSDIEITSIYLVTEDDNERVSYE